MKWFGLMVCLCGFDITECGQFSWTKTQLPTLFKLHWSPILGNYTHDPSQTLFFPCKYKLKRNWNAQQRVFNYNRMDENAFQASQSHLIFQLHEHKYITLTKCVCVFFFCLVLSHTRYPNGEFFNFTKSIDMGFWSHNLKAYFFSQCIKKEVWLWLCFRFVWMVFDVYIWFTAAVSTSLISIELFIQNTNRITFLFVYSFVRWFVEAF